jgi:hypothetical protein
MLDMVHWIMKFLYILPVWEGSTSGSKVLRDAMSCQDGFVVPKGMALCLGILFLAFYFFISLLTNSVAPNRKYSVDAGYTNGRSIQIHSVPLERVGFKSTTAPNSQRIV